MGFVPVEVGQFAIDWYGAGRVYQNNLRINTHNPTDGERIASNSSRLTSRLFAFRKEPRLKHFPTIEKLDPGILYCPLLTFSLLQHLIRILLS